MLNDSTQPVVNNLPSIISSSELCFNDIVSIEKVSGERSVKDMKEKIDIVCISSSGEEINIQVKPRGEKITIWDKTSKANFFAFVDGNNNVEYKSNKDIM